jgi:hypothetical protein
MLDQCQEEEKECVVLPQKLEEVQLCQGWLEEVLHHHHLDQKLRRLPTALQMVKSQNGSKVMPILWITSSQIPETISIRSEKTLIDSIELILHRPCYSHPLRNWNLPKKDLHSQPRPIFE